MSLKPWLQLFRAHTAPALWCLILTPYLHNAKLLTVETGALFLIAHFTHHLAWGQNSLMDTTQGYDQKDPSKTHHPLISGVLEIPPAVNVIYWGLGAMMTIAVAYTWLISPAPAAAMAGLTLWMAWGWGYNCGLNKESLLGGLPITLSFTGMAAWGWYLSHSELGYLGLLSVGYVFMQGVYMNGWTNQMKDFAMKERSNLPYVLGARVKKGVFDPGLSIWFPLGSKAINLWILLKIAKEVATPAMSLADVWIAVMIVVIVVITLRQTFRRTYVHRDELKLASLMEMLTILAPMPLLIGWFKAIPIMAAGVIYFFAVNKYLWEDPYPKV